MAVPSPSKPALANTTGGAFTEQTQGGTILGNGTTGSVITNAFLLLDAVDDLWNQAAGPVERAYPAGGGMYGTQKALAGGTFAYFEAGKYIIRTISTTISGVASNEVLIPGSNSSNQGNAIAQFIHDFGVRLLAKWRANEFSWTGVLDDGTKIPSRLNWINAAGNAAEAPATATDLDPLSPQTGAAARRTDVAANPTRALPGTLVMKADFVDLNYATGGDFFDYKPITGM
jgi:hypothetical protein